MNPGLVAGIVGLISSLVLTEAVRRMALRRGILDVPNSRSAHTVARPRGGGAAIVVALPLAAAAALAAGGVIDRRYWYGVALATLVAGVGLADDIRRLDYRPRLLAQLAAAAALVLVVGPIEAIVIPGVNEPVHVEVAAPAAAAITLLAVVGFTNAFNFMDGIDGLAAGQAVTGALLIAAMQPADAGPAAAALAGAGTGFLIHNLPPARVFLGDVGSQYLGFLLAALALTGERVGAVPASLSALIFLPFGVDTVVTLAGRLLRGERWHEPHQHHTYQRLVAAGWSHARTTALYTALTLASGISLLVVQRSHSYGWLWWMLALLTMVIVGILPSACRRVMLRR